MCLGFKKNKTKNMRTVFISSILYFLCSGKSNKYIFLCWEFSWEKKAWLFWSIMIMRSEKAMD